MDSNYNYINVRSLNVTSIIIYSFLINSWHVISYDNIIFVKCFRFYKYFYFGSLQKNRRYVQEEPWCMENSKTKKNKKLKLSALFFTSIRQVLLYIHICRQTEKTHFLFSPFYIFKVLFHLDFLNKYLKMVLYYAYYYVI